MSGPTAGTAGRALDAEAERIRKVYAVRSSGSRYAWTHPGQLFMMQELERRLLAALRRHDCVPLEHRRILEIGCGTGHFLRELVKWGADPARTAGIDLLEDRLAVARALSPAGVRLECRDAADSGYPSGSFDLILQMTVFTSILSAEVRHRVAGEMLRLLASGGKLIWYDFRVDNPRNANVRGVRKAEIRSLFPGCAIDLKRVTLAPPLARTLAGRSRAVFALLNAMPFLRTHYLAVISPP